MKSSCICVLFTRQREISGKLLTRWMQECAEIVCMWSTGGCDVLCFFSPLPPVNWISPGTSLLYFWKQLKVTQISTQTFPSAFLMNFYSPLFLCKCSDVLYIEMPSHESCQVRFTVHSCIRWLPGTFCVCVSFSLSASLSSNIFALCEANNAARKYF